MNNKNEPIINNEKNLPEIEVYLSKRKLFLIIFPSCIFIVISILMFINRRNYMQMIISIVIFILFGICFIVFASQLLKSHTPVFILNENGLIHNILLRNKNLFIKWKEIKEIHFTNTFIYIYLMEESDLLKNKKNSSEPIVLYMSELDMKKETFIYLVDYYFDNYKNLNLENNINSQNIFNN